MPPRTLIKLEQLQQGIAGQILKVGDTGFIEFSNIESVQQNIDGGNATSLYTPSLILDGGNA